MNSILFFTLSLEHTTHRKAAYMLNKEGAKVKMIGLTRKNYPASPIKEFEFNNLGQIDHGNYFKRLIKLFFLIPKLRKEAASFNTIYCFTLDGLLIMRLALLFTNKKWIYQVQDIRGIFFGNSLKSKLARQTEKFLSKRIDLLVVSSYEYYSKHFKRWYNFDYGKTVVIENKLDKTILNNNYIKGHTLLDNNKITFGYFGVMRCEVSWNILKRLATSFPDLYNVYLRGKPTAMTNLESEIEGTQNIKYDGLYKSPEELADIYSMVDLVWACYPYSESKTGNWEMARTIRFYEAIAFGKPLIVQKGTAQEKDVLKYKIGLVIDMSNVEGTIKKLREKITKENINLWQTNIGNLSESIYFHSDEYKQLLERINSL